MKSISALATVQIIAVDLAKEVFQPACADANFRIVQSLRLKRVDFLKFWNNLAPVHVVMEACGSAHHFGRWLTSLGHRVSLLPAQLANALLDQNIRALLLQVLEEIEGFEQQVIQLDRRLQALSENDSVLVKLESLPGIGWITATALRASVGDIRRFKNGRTLANWIGFTPKEHSSGSTRSLGRMSKQGDAYLRTMMIQGARSVLAHAIKAAQLQKPLGWHCLSAMPKRGSSIASRSVAAKKR